MELWLGPQNYWWDFLLGLFNYWWDESHQYLTLVGQSPSVPPKITPLQREIILQEFMHQHPDKLWSIGQSHITDTKKGSS